MYGIPSLQATMGEDELMQTISDGLVTFSLEK
jgi:hypothetical protein